MYTVDRIEEETIILENRITKEIKEINKEEIKQNVKDGDIISFENNTYKIKEEETIKVSKNIKNRFNKLKKK